MTIANNSPILFNKINDEKISVGLYAYAMKMQDERNKIHLEMLKLDVFGKMIVGCDLGLSKKYEPMERTSANNQQSLIKQEQDLIAGMHQAGFNIVEK